MREGMKRKGREWDFSWYAGCMVTPNCVFEIAAPKAEDVE
jgi:hypothetical protein